MVRAVRVGAGGAGDFGGGGGAVGGAGARPRVARPCPARPTDARLLPARPAGGTVPSSIAGRAGYGRAAFSKADGSAGASIDGDRHSVGAEAFRLYGRGHDHDHPPLARPRRRLHHRRAVGLRLRLHPQCGRGLLPGALALGRLLAGTLVLGAILIVRREGLPGRGAWPGIITSGVLWFGLYMVALNWGEQEVDAGTAAMLVNIGPILIALLGARMLGEGAAPAAAGDGRLVRGRGRGGARDVRARRLLRAGRGPSACWRPWRTRRAW